MACSRFLLPRNRCVQHWPCQVANLLEWATKTRSGRWRSARTGAGWPRACGQDGTAVGSAGGHSGARGLTGPRKLGLGGGVQSRTGAGWPQAVRTRRYGCGIGRRAQRSPWSYGATKTRSGRWRSVPTGAGWPRAVGKDGAAVGSTGAQRSPSSCGATKTRCRGGFSPDGLAGHGSWTDGAAVGWTGGHSGARGLDGATKTRSPRWRSVPDGRWLATGSGDKTVRLWDRQADTAEPVVLRGHEDSVSAVAFESRRALAGHGQSGTR